MRPRSILVCASVLVLAAVLVSAPGAAARHPAARNVICPQAAGPACCGPPTGGGTAEPAGGTAEPAGSATEPACCPTVTVQCGDRITLASSEDPATEGSKLVLSGELIETSNSGQTVTLWEEPAGSSSFKQAQTTSTGSGGAYSFTVAAGSATTNTSWYATADGLQSTTLQEQMSARVTLSAKRAGRRYRLSGTVTPAQSGQLIRLQGKSGGKWVTFATVRLSRKSAFNFKTKAGKRGKTAVRALFAGDSSNIESVSPTVRSPT